MEQITERAGDRLNRAGNKDSIGHRRSNSNPAPAAPTMTNSPRQPMNGTSSAPNGEPKAIPPAIAPNSQPRGRPRCSYGYNLPTRANASGTTPLAPIPVTIRHRASCSMDCAVTVANVSPTKAVRDTNITRWMPSRSAKRPYARVAIP